MKIIATIPVERAQVSKDSYTFIGEEHVVDIVRVVRWNGTSVPGKTRWHYLADIAEHPLLHKDACRIGPGGEYRVCIDRGLNPKWRPPFAKCSTDHVFEVKREGGAA